MTNKEKAKVLGELLKSDGWKLIEEWLKQTEEVSLNNLIHADNADARAICVGFYRAIKQVRNWPASYGRFATAQAEAQVLQGDEEYESIR